MKRKVSLRVSVVHYNPLPLFSGPRKGEMYSELHRDKNPTDVQSMKGTGGGPCNWVVETKTNWCLSFIWRCINRSLVHVTFPASTSITPTSCVLHVGTMGPFWVCHAFMPVVFIGMETMTRGSWVSCIESDGDVLKLVLFSCGLTKFMHFYNKRSLPLWAGFSYYLCPWGPLLKPLYQRTFWTFLFLLTDHFWLCPHEGLFIANSKRMTWSGRSLENDRLYKVPKPKAVDFFLWISPKVVVTDLIHAFSCCGNMANLIT